MSVQPRPSFSHMFYPREPVRSGLHASYGCDQTTSIHEFVFELKKNKISVWPTSGHVSGIKVEEVGGLGGSFYTRGRASSHVFKKEPVEPLVRCLHVEHSLALSSPPETDLWPHWAALSFSYHLLSNECLCLYDGSLSSLSSPPYTSLVPFKVSSCYKERFSCHCCSFEGQDLGFCEVQR